MAKHYRWQDLYKESDDRYGVLREFISTAVNVIYDDIMVNDKKLADVLKSADVISRRIAAERVGLHDEWKLHKTWFRCGWVQLALYGACVNDWKTSGEIKEQMRNVYNQLGWDFESALNPKYTDLLTVETLDFFKGYDDKGEKIYGKFKAILEPLAKYPDGSVYESKHSGNRWVLCYAAECESYRMVAEEKDKHGNYREMDMKRTDLLKMKRII